MGANACESSAGTADLLRHILPVTRRSLGLRNDAAVVSTLAPYPVERIGVATLIASAADDKYGSFSSCFEGDRSSRSSVSEYRSPRRDTGRKCSRAGA